MERALPTLLIFTCFVISLSACTTWKQTSGGQHANMCKHLSTKMIFNGATSNTRMAEIQDAEQPLDQRYFDKNCT